MESRFNSQTLTVAELMLLVADILLLVAVFWTIMSGVEYFVGVLPLFRPERLARPLEKGHA
jgi:CDP-diacylglycerol---glycerol-3-phosphate 3-phosphatidyltransferase